MSQTATPLTLSRVRVLLFVREMPGGDSWVFPIAEPQYASYDLEDDAIFEQGVFLPEHLSRVDPEIVARHAFPDGTSLHIVKVLVPREDLPRRVTIDTPIAIASVVVPTLPNARGERDAWVFVVPLETTIYVPFHESLDEAVAAEVKRAVVAREMTAAEYLKLLPGEREAITSIEVAIARNDAAAPGGAKQLRRAIAERDAKRAAADVLASVGTQMLIEGKPPRPVVGREQEIGLLTALLGGEERVSVVIAGASRVGKTSLLEAWFHREHQAGRSRSVFVTSGAQLIAGMSGLGQWQERARRVMEAAERLDAVLVLEDLGDLLAERGSGHVDFPGFMKPYLDEGRVRVVGELDADDAERAEARHAGFFAAMSRIRLAPLTKERTAEALSAHAAWAAAYDADRPQIEASAWVPLLDLADRYLPYEAFPGRAIRLFDELRAAERFAGLHARITARDVFDAFSARSGIPAFLLRDDETRSLADITAHFTKRLVGQTEAIKRVAETVCVVKAGVQPQGKPLATFLFVGPTGVGKTELARALAELLFGHADRLVRFDMSEYGDAYAAERLFRGTDRGEGLLTRQIREQPFSVVLLDEIEKAHPAVFDLLLQVCGEGRLTDGRGRTAFFHNAILIMTSNLGAAHRRPSLGFDPAALSDDAHYVDAVHATFRPEMVNRIDRIVAFRALTRAEARQVVRLAVAKVAARSGLADAGAELRVDDAALDWLAESGFSPAYGARALRRHVDAVMVSPMAGLMAAVGDVQNTLITVGVSTGAPPRAGEIAIDEVNGLRFALTPRGRATVAARGEHAMREISGVRREMQKERSLDRVGQLADRVASLVAQLGHGERKRRNASKVRGAELAQMQAEHHRLAKILEDLDAAYVDACSLEELGIEALFAGESVEALAREARGARARWRAALVRALVADESDRDGCVLMLQEIGRSDNKERMLDLWLAPFLKAAEARGWKTTLHLQSDARAPDGAWPADRAWGPPRDAAWAIEKLASAERPTGAWLLRVSGANAGILMALEAGLHRHAHREIALMLVTLLARKEHLSDADWSKPWLTPVAPPKESDVKKGALCRDYDGVEARLAIFGHRFTMPLAWVEYWQRFDEIALAHLLLVEHASMDRDALLAPKIRDDDAIDADSEEAP